MSSAITFDLKDLATKQDLALVESNLRKDMAELKSEMLRAMMLQTFAIGDCGCEVYGVIS